MGPCYKCNKYGHLMADCPIMVATSSSSKKKNKKKAFQATWDDSESESEEDNDKANMCFMASNKVNSNPDNDLIFDDTAHAFKELNDQYKILRSKHAKLKKEHEKLFLKYNSLKEENDRLIVAHNKIKEDLNSNLSSCSSKRAKVPINHDEIDDMKIKMDVLSSTLSKCAFDNKKLELMFRKKSTHSFHASHHSHAHHNHNDSHSHHAFMYANVYNYTFCGRKGHLSKLCYDHLNMSNTQTWVKKSNPIRPNKIWVLKSPHNVGDVGTIQSGLTQLKMIT